MASKTQQSEETKKIIRNCKKMMDNGATYKEVTNGLEEKFKNK